MHPLSPPSLESIRFPKDYPWKDHKYEAPSKKIKDPQGLEAFKLCPTYTAYMTFIGGMQMAVEGKPISATVKNARLEAYQGLVDRLVKLVDEVPPVQQQCRFGNIAYKDWHDKAMVIGQEFFQKLLPEDKQGAKEELMVYFYDSFGSNVRLDYGTGHEQNFAQILFILFKMRLLEESDFEGLVHHVFNGYIQLMRKIQTVYWLEPAGSNGVWGLDDHHFLPFLFGGAELVGHTRVKIPADIHKQELLDEYADDFMYLDCIRHIKKIKKGGRFEETSPVLNDISNAASWMKIAGGMVKMYEADVLTKLVVAKHLWFGSLFPF